MTVPVNIFFHFEGHVFNWPSGSFSCPSQHIRVDRNFFFHNITSTIFFPVRITPHIHGKVLWPIIEPTPDSVWQFSRFNLEFQRPGQFIVRINGAHHAQALRCQFGTSKILSPYFICIRWFPPDTPNIFGAGCSDFLCLPANPQTPEWFHHKAGLWLQRQYLRKRRPLCRQN